MLKSTVDFIKHWMLYAQSLTSSWSVRCLVITFPYRLRLTVSLKSSEFKLVRPKSKAARAAASRSSAHGKCQPKLSHLHNPDVV